MSNLLRTGSVIDCVSLVTTVSFWERCFHVAVVKNSLTVMI